jgi:high-affinity iron transporter
MKRLPAAFILICALAIRAQAGEIARDFERVQTQLEELLLDALGNRPDPANWEKLRAAADTFAADLSEARTYWQNEMALAQTDQPPNANALADFCGSRRAILQHVAALEMLARHHASDVAGAQTWRALIAIPKHANSVEGALALQRLGEKRIQETQVRELLSREYMAWQATRVREELAGLKRAVEAGRANAALAHARLAETRTLSDFPPAIRAAAKLTEQNNLPDLRSLLAFADADQWPAFLDKFATWRNAIETQLPNLLTPEQVQRSGRLLVKLVRLVPKEYHNGVRDGQVVVPLEYREAKDFTEQAQQLVSELSGAWRARNSRSFEKDFAELVATLEESESLIAAKEDGAKIEERAREIEKILTNKFHLNAGTAGGDRTVDETVLEVRTALTQSLAAAQQGRWSDAEDARVEAYTTFDLEIEKRVLPRDPELGLRAERSFLDGEPDRPGIKALLVQRKRGAELEAAYRRAFEAVDSSRTLLKVNLSPVTVIYTVLAICAREGLEAVVVLAALLAGMRAPEQRTTRKRVVTGAWLAVVATAITFWISRTIIVSLSRFGEKLEAVISVLAVIVLLMVTNWVFHKVYWVGWNAKLRKLSKSGESRLEWLSLVTVGFLTIYREGFETTLFLQSLILEAGMRWVSIGIICGAILVGTAGVMIFVIGARLPYRKLLIFTGILVVTILVTFLGSTVRLFQTVGWMPIHPLTGLNLPAWAGFWLGLYPSVEGIVIPLLGLVYVAAAWLVVKWQALRRGAREIKAALEREAFAMQSALAKRSPLS